jgi:L-fuculose-phosphate aldolase
MATGVPFHTSTAQDVVDKRAYIYSDTAVKSYWEYSVRQVHRAAPEASTWF